MKKIAIKPHKTRGIELIKILERMGGYNSHHLDGFSFRDDTAYLINENGIITSYTEHLCHEKGYKIYTLEEWEDEYKSDKMIEGLVEDVNVSEFKHTQDEIMKMLLQGALNIPEGYCLRDQDGNIINAKYVTLEKKKREYPKTYEECCEVLDIIDNRPPWHGYRSVQLKIFQKLLVCRDAYWKIAGEEMGLGKPWEPDWEGEGWYVIINHRGDIVTDVQWHANAILAFPTEEMRDEFKENFGPDIDVCKEFL